MNWLVFLIAAWLLTSIQLGVRHFLPGTGDIAPSLTIPLLVFAGLTAPNRHALWAAVLLGVLVDLTTSVRLADNREALTIIGPHVLGYILACQLVLAARGIVIPRHPLTHLVLGLLGGLIATVVVVAIFTVRNFYPESRGFEPLRELRVGLFSAMLTAIASMVIVPVLFVLARPLGMPVGHHSYAPSGNRDRRLRMLR